MKALWLLLLLAVPLQFTHAQEVKHAPTAELHTGATAYQTAKGLRDLCREYITDQCLGYIQGASDAFDLAMFELFPIKPCVPEEATAEELVPVFLKFIDDHPEKLSYGAADVLWQAMAAAFPSLPCKD